MKSSIKIALLSVIMILTSCATFKEIPLPTNTQTLTKDNLHQLSGSYQRMANNQTKAPRFYNFEDAFQCFFHRREKTILDTTLHSQDQLALQVLNDKHIRISFLRNGETLKSVVLKGKLTNNSFELNYRYYFIPLVAINFFQYRKTRLILLENGNLNIDAFIGAISNVAIFVSSRKKSGNQIEFQKVE